jgi:uridine phosphorylase
MKASKYPILEYGPTIPAIIEPSQAVQDISAPEACVFCFFRDVIEDLNLEGRLKRIASYKWEDFVRPLYEMDVNGGRVSVFQPGVGAPLAAALMEEVIASGCRKIIACGGAGVLDSKIAVGSVLVPTAAMRDEGTSFHYLPPGREIEADGKVVSVIENVLRKKGIEYKKVKTWTTDGPYRETPAKIKLRKGEGCLTVEMESAAFMAVAQFREVLFGQLLYGGDDISGTGWDTRDWQNLREDRKRLFWLSVDVCVNL